MTSILSKPWMTLKTSLTITPSRLKATNKLSRRIHDRLARKREHPTMVKQLNRGSLSKRHHLKHLSLSVTWYEKFLGTRLIKKK